METEYPRVVSLTYRIVSDEMHEYEKNASFDGELRGFGVQLRHRAAVFTPLMHFGTEELARAALDPQLQAWELDAILTHGLGVMAFKYLTAHLQQNPPQPRVAEASGAAAMSFAVRGMVTIIHDRYPAPPQGFVVDEYVQVLGDLYLLGRGTPRTLLYIAYSMRTCVAQYFDGLTSAATRLGISRNVFDKIDELANTRGVGAEIRKFSVRTQRAPLSQAERDWLMQVLELIVRRAGAAAAGAPIGERVTLETMPLPAKV